MKIVKIITLVLLITLVGIQFVPTTRNQSDIVPKTDFMIVNEVPAYIKEKIKIACYDCHSNNTQYPWYNKVQPMAWLLQRHIADGRSELNFNEWGTYSNRRKKSKLKSTISQIENGEMPMNSYTIIHKDAKFSDSEKLLVTGWITQLRDSL